METSKTGPSRGIAAALALLCAALAPQPAAAQQRDVERRECQCVDAQGREIERCVCVIGPEVERLQDWAGGLERIGDRFGAFPFNGRAVLGVGIFWDQAAELDAQGARVGEVEPESGAAEAGLEEGDVIVSLDGRSLLEPLADADAEAELDADRSLPVQRMLALLADHEPGDEVEIEYLRDGVSGTATVGLQAPRPFFLDRGVRVEAPFARRVLPGTGPRPPMMTIWNGAANCPALVADRGAVLGWGRSCAAGAELLELGAGLAEYFQAEAGDVLVSDVAANHPLGLAAGDVIVAVGGREVRGLEHALGMLRSYRDDEQVVVSVIRRGQAQELTGTLR